MSSFSANNRSHIFTNRLTIHLSPICTMCLFLATNAQIKDEYDPCIHDEKRKKIRAFVAKIHPTKFVIASTFLTFAGDEVKAT